jgi:hypothetical protein
VTPSNDSGARILFLTTVRSYRLDAFREAAQRLAVNISVGIDLPPEIASHWSDALTVNFGDVEASVARIVEFAADNPLNAILSVDDSGSTLAAAASAALGLPHNDPAATEAARNKYVMRSRLRDAGLPVPWFRQLMTSDDPGLVGPQLSYPCVIKPLNLNGSRGVMRVNSPEEFVTASRRLASLLSRSSENSQPFLVEGFMPGFEVALEGILDKGALKVLALFDKPDPLDGPFFEETIYVTPSRLPGEVQAAIASTTAAAASALGLTTGPIHAELRIDGLDVWIVEIAGRSIGGLCSEVLRFGVDASLEELIIRQAAGRPLGDTSRRDLAAGVMMIPIQFTGLLREIDGLDDAESVALVERIEITARLNYPLTPLPEGDSYLGFIFARGDSPDEVELALRQAYSCLAFRTDPVLTVLNPFVEPQPAMGACT